MRTTPMLFVLAIFSVINLSAQVNFIPQTIDPFGGQTFFPVDLNGDGFKDIVSEQYWLRNDGNNNFTENPLNAEKIFDYGDLDGDGDIDLMGMGGNFPEEIVWLENDGTGTFTSHYVGSIIGGFLDGELRDLHAADMDGDGDLDIVTASRSQNLIGSFTIYVGSVVWWENRGANFVEHSVDGGRNVYPEDIDGDGDIDLVTTSRIENTFNFDSQLRIDWQENVGNGNFVRHNLRTALNAFIGITPYVLDVDNDGDMDILTNFFSWWENNGNSNFTERVISTTPVAHISSADVDGDGDLDLLTAQPTTVWWEYIGNNDFTMHEIVEDFSDFIAGDDFDNDGDTDIFTTSIEGGIWWENDSGVLPPDCEEDIDGFSYLGESDNHKYFLSNEIRSWEDAAAIAESNGGYLAAINSEVENIFLQNQLGTQIVHIGFHDAGTEGNYEWDSGEALNFDKHDGANSEDNDYGVMNFWDGSWSLVNQWVHKRFIMEIACGPTTPSLTVNCPTDINISVAPGETGAEIDFELPTASSNCGTIAISQSNGPTSGDFVALGTVIIEFEITLTCGNDQLVETCSFEINIEEIDVNCSEDIPGFTYWGEYNGHKYFLSQDIQTHAVAQSIAMANGAYLASIDDQGENDFLQNQLNLNIVHIGLSDEASEGTLAWDSGDAVAFNNHDGGNSVDNNFGVLNFWDGSWTLVNKWVQKQFIMEVPCAGSAPPFLSIVCPDNIIVDAEPLLGGATVTFDEVQIFTNCDDTGMALISGIPSGAFFPVGTTTNIYEVIAFCGTDFITEICSFNVTVEPVQSGPVSLTADCGSTFFIEVPFPETGTNIFYPEPDVSFECPVGGEISFRVLDGPPLGTFVSLGGYTIVFESMLECGTTILRDTCALDVIVEHGSTNIGESIVFENPGEKPNVPHGDKVTTLALGKIYPNPADREVTLSIYSPGDKNTVVEVFDAFGKRVWRQPISLYKGSNQLPLDIADFMAGVFIVKVGVDKERAVVSRFVKILD